jgi:glycosyltransferase involved in cell wall biosynthesis
MKVIEALRAGAPVVATPLAVRGIAVEPGCDILVAADAPGLAREIVRLLRDPRLRDAVAAAGRRAAERHSLVLRASALALLGPPA